jgi:hypothetical protein
MLSGWGSPMSTSQRVNRGFHTLGLLLAGTCALSIVLMKPAIAACEQGTPVSGRIYVKGDEINFRTVPGTNYDSVVNQRATQVLGTTEYRKLSPSYVLEAVKKGRLERRWRPCRA